MQMILRKGRGINNAVILQPKTVESMEVNGICAVLLMQFLPFVGKEAVGLLNDLERAVYASLGK